MNIKKEFYKDVLKTSKELDLSKDKIYLKIQNLIESYDKDPDDNAIEEQFANIYLITAIGYKFLEDLDDILHLRKN